MDFARASFTVYRFFFRTTAAWVHLEHARPFVAFASVQWTSTHLVIDFSSVGLSKKIIFSLVLRRLEFHFS